MVVEITPHLVFAGQCEEAFKFYERVIGGKIVTMLTWGQSPMAEQVPAHWQSKILHASLTLPGAALIGADVLPEQYERPKGFYVLLGIDEPTDAERMFSSLAENGVVAVPMQQTFWSVRFGVVVDRFGIPWEVSCGQVASQKTKTSTESKVTVV
jgi:PhnB protein